MVLALLNPLMTCLDISLNLDLFLVLKIRKLVIFQNCVTFFRYEDEVI